MGATYRFLIVIHCKFKIRGPKQSMFLLTWTSLYVCYPILLFSGISKKIKGSNLSKSRRMMLTELGISSGNKMPYKNFNIKLLVY